MPELLENHWGFDANQLGFPSISACRAIIVQTTAGLFGYHMSSSHLSAADRARDFAGFATGHASWPGGGGAKLYCIAYTQKPNTGYGEGTALTEWKAETRIFADALGVTGRRMGYCLTAAEAAGSAYVRAGQTTGFADIWVAQWDDHATYVTKGPFTPTANHAWRGLQNTRTVVTAVNIPTTSLKKINVQSLDS